MDDQPGELTALIEQARSGDADARDRLTRAVYGEMRRMAAALLRRERPDPILQPSALVNEALMRLFVGDVLARAEDRRYLFGAAARAMRQVLVDHARARDAARRSGRIERVPLDDILDSFDDRRIDVLALHESLDRLMELNERQGLVVSLRFFLGMTVAEVAEALGVSTGTVEGDWRVARAWFRGRLGDAPA